MINSTIKTSCPAKVNLTFQIVGLLPDGYHEVKTLMQSVSLEDELTFHFSSGDGNIRFSSVDSNFASGFPADESNLIVKAIRKFQQAVPASLAEDVDVSVIKRIPIGAGLAGGSANAAAALIAMNSRYGNSLQSSEITSLGTALGADVPFCLLGGTAVGAHKGDVLSVLEGASKLVFLLVKPQKLSVSTPWAFNEFDKLVSQKFTSHSTEYDTTTKCAETILREKASGIAPYLVNDLELPVFHYYPKLNHIREKLENFGAVAGRLTGSGPTLYGLFSSTEEAEAAKSSLDVYQLDRVPDESNPIYPLDSWVVESSCQGARLV